MRPSQPQYSSYVLYSANSGKFREVFDRYEAALTAASIVKPDTMLLGRKKGEDDILVHDVYRWLEQLEERIKGKHDTRAIYCDMPDKTFYDFLTYEEAYGWAVLHAHEEMLFKFYVGREGENINYAMTPAEFTAAYERGDIGCPQAQKSK